MKKNKNNHASSQGAAAKHEKKKKHEKNKCQVLPQLLNDECHDEDGRASTANTFNLFRALRLRLDNSTYFRALRLRLILKRDSFFVFSVAFPV